MQTERRVAANPQTKPTDLGCESAERLAATIRRHHRHLLLLLSSFYHPMESGRLSWPRHCSKGAQPVPKAVYRSDCRDKHDWPRWDSNLGPLTPPPVGRPTTKPPRPAVKLTIKRKQQTRLLTLSAAALPENTAHNYHLHHQVSSVQAASSDFPIYYNNS